MKVVSILKNEKVLLNQVKIADNIITRFKGLMLRKKLNDGEGLIITPCNSIHMFFMRMPLDIIFLNNNNEIVEIVENIKPWRMTKMYFNADYVIEIEAGLSKKLSLKKGDILEIK